MNPACILQPDWSTQSRLAQPASILLKKDEGRSPDFEACALLNALKRILLYLPDSFRDQSSGAERKLLTCCGDTGVPWLPHDIRMYVTTAATSVSDKACANGGMPYGCGLPSVLGG